MASCNVPDGLEVPENPQKQLMVSFGNHKATQQTDQAHVRSDRWNTIILNNAELTARVATIHVQVYRDEGKKLKRKVFNCKKHSTPFVLEKAKEQHNVMVATCNHNGERKIKLKFHCGERCLSTRSKPVFLQFKAVHPVSGEAWISHFHQIFITRQSKRKATDTPTETLQRAVKRARTRQDRAVNRLTLETRSMAHADDIARQVVKHVPQPTANNLNFSIDAVWKAAELSDEHPKGSRIAAILQDNRPLVLGQILKSNGNTPLHVAAAKGSRMFVRTILGQLKPTEQLDAFCKTLDNDGFSAFGYAVKHSHYEILDEFFHILHDDKRKHVKDWDKGMGPDNIYPLTWAANKGDASTLLTLLKEGAGIDRLSKNDDTILHVCARNGGVTFIHKYALEDILQRKGIEALLVRNAKGYTPLHIAAGRGHLRMVSYLLTKCPSALRIKDGKQCTALHRAALIGHFPIVKLFICNITTLEELVERTVLGDTILHLAASSGNKEMFKFIIDKIRELAPQESIEQIIQNCLNQVSRKGLTPLGRAIRARRWGLTEYLIGMQDDLHHLRNHMYSTVLHEACQRDNPITAKLLWNLKDTQNKYGWTPISCSARYGGVQALKVILNAHGPNVAESVNHKDIHNRTPLHHAVAGGHVWLTELLLNTHVINTNVRCNERKTPLDVLNLCLERYKAHEPGSKRKRYERIQEIFSRFGVSKVDDEDAPPVNAIEDILGNVDVHIKHTALHRVASVYFGEITDEISKLCEMTTYTTADIHGDLPLHLAAASNNTKIFKRMFTELSDDTRMKWLLQKNNNCYTPLQEAVFHGSYDIVDFIIQSLDEDDRIEVCSCIDYDANTLMHTAAQSNEPLIMQLLLDSIPNIKTQLKAVNHNTRIPISMAVVYGSVEVFEMLLLLCSIEERYKMLSKKDAYGYTCIHLAAIEGRKEIVEILIREKAQLSVISYQGLSPLDNAKQRVKEMETYFPDETEDSNFLLGRFKEIVKLLEYQTNPSPSPTWDITEEIVNALPYDVEIGDGAMMELLSGANSTSYWT